MHQLCCHLSNPCPTHPLGSRTGTQMIPLNCASKLPHLLKWFKSLCDLEPKYGYYPEPQKTVLIIDSTIMDEAKVLYHLGLSVVRGHHFLGGFIGDNDSTSQFVESKIKEWTASIITLSKAAQIYPQAAFVALSKSLQFE